MSEPELRAEVERLRETNTRLNRRAQQAEAALADALRCSDKLASGAAWCGGSLGRALLAWQCKKLDERVKELEAEVRRLNGRDMEWWAAARDAMAGDLYPDKQCDTAALYELYRGRGWSDVPEPVQKLMCDQRDAAIARAKNLAEALEPFAQLAGWVDVAGDEESCTPPLPDRYLLTWTATVKPEGIDHLPGHPTVGDCRRAAEVLALAVEMREGVP